MYEKLQNLENVENTLKKRFEKSVCVELAVESCCTKKYNERGF